MLKVRLSTKLLLSMLLVSAALTGSSLLFVQHFMQAQVRREIQADLRSSELTFQNLQKQREIALSRSAELLADLPTLRALMTGTDPRTIQDASQEVWRLSGSDLLVLADRGGRVVALHTSTPGFTPQSAQELFHQTLQEENSNHWWFGGGHLYEVFVQPIYFGPATDNRVTGALAVGYEVNEQLLREFSHTAGSEIIFWYGRQVARSTIAGANADELVKKFGDGAFTSHSNSEIELGSERFLSSSVELTPGTTPAVHLQILKSYDEATAFLKQLNRSLLALGLVAILGGSVLVFAISHTVTRPLANLVSGVRALGTGDYGYPVEEGEAGGDEVAQLTRAFNRMRESLQKSQRELLEAERLATIGRMASSISHDLRHSLAAVVANAEFLSEVKLDAHQREDLYREVRIAVDQMTEMLESLLEFSRTSETLRPSYGSLREPLERAIQTVRAHPDANQVPLAFNYEDPGESWFDFKRLERAFQNLLLNAFEAVPHENGRVELSARKLSEHEVEIVVRDNGPGIPEDIRGRLFEPFVSSGKQNGTGLGLTVVQKIVQDHGGRITVESTSESGTIFRVVLPLILEPHQKINRGEQVGSAVPIIR
jgi:signal transduction histidine kinase